MSKPKQEGHDAEQRRAIRQSLLDKGVQPYPQDGHKKHTNAESLALEEGAETIIAGRVRAIRGHGKIHFIDVYDESAKMQVVIRVDETIDADFIKNFDTGDFIRVTGTRITTAAGEPSVLAKSFEMLSKALRELPQELSDEESRYRNRSVDLAVNRELAEIFKKRSVITTSVRETLIKMGFLEVETPVLQPLYGGANAEPFTTHINAWDMIQYLRISPELYLKYLIMGDFEKVFEIAKDFRNEGVDKTHNPEFTMMECYAAYWDYNDMMNLTEEIYRNACLAANGTDKITYQGTEIDFSQTWKRLTMKDGIRDYLGLDVDQMSDEEIQAAIVENGEEYKGDWIRGLGIAKLFGAVEKNLVQPTFVIDMPRETTALCKPHRDDPKLIERFEPYIGGMEVGNAYTELNDPVLQRQFMEDERDEDDKHPLDEGFIRAMEYGMPPTGGLGLGIDRMALILLDQTKLRNVILFPTMKPKKEEDD